MDGADGAEVWLPDETKTDNEHEHGEDQESEDEQERKNDETKPMLADSFKLAQVRKKIIKLKLFSRCVSHPFNIGCLPLSYSDNPGVSVSHREGCRSSTTHTGARADPSELAQQMFMSLKKDEEIRIKERDKFMGDTITIKFHKIRRSQQTVRDTWKTSKRQVTYTRIDTYQMFKVSKIAAISKFGAGWNPPCRDDLGKPSDLGCILDPDAAVVIPTGLSWCVPVHQTIYFSAHRPGPLYVH